MSSLGSTDFSSADSKFVDIERKYLDVDPDLRFMALSDLRKMLLEHTLIITKVGAYSDKIIGLLLKALKDPNDDVQNQALRCFEPLVGSLSDEQILFTLAQLNKQQVHSNSITTSIQTTAIGEVLKNINLKHASTGARIVDNLLPSLVNLSGKAESLDSIEILTELVKNLGNTIPHSQLAHISTALVKTIFRGENMIGKRAIACLGFLAPYITTPQLQSLLQLIDSEQGTGYNNITLALLTYITLAKSDPTRFTPYLDNLFKFASAHLYLDDDELNDDQIKIDDVRYQALQLIDTLLAAGQPAAVYVSQVMEIIKKFLVYDPYNNVMDEDDEDEYSDDDFSEDEYDDEESDDNTWKLRKQSSKLTATVVKYFPSALPMVYSSGIFDSILKSVSDSSDAVSFENIHTLDIIVQASMTIQGQRSVRKRKNSDVEMQDSEDPSTSLAKYRTSIVTKFIKELNGTKANDSNKYSELLNFFQKFNKLDEDLKPLLTCIREHNFGTNLDMLKFYSAVLRNNHIDYFGSEFNYIIETINTGLSSKNHVSITNSIATSIDLLDLTYNESLVEALVSIASTNKNDSGIRNAAIEALGKVKTLPPVKVAEILTMFAETLRYEPIAATTIAGITQFADNYGETINCPAMEQIIGTYKTLLESEQFAADVIESLVSVSAAVSIDASIGKQLMTTFNEDAHQSQILRILSHLDISKADLMTVFTKASNSGEVEEFALLDVSTKIGADLIPTLEEHMDDIKNVKLLANIVVHEKLAGYVAQREQELLSKQNVFFNLKFLGYVGETVDLSITVEQLMAFFGDEENKVIAAETIGKVVSKNGTAYLPGFLQKIMADENRFLLLTSLKQVLLKDKKIQHELYTAIWDTLISVVETLETIDENLIKIIAHCIGLVLVSNNDTHFFYNKVSDLLNSQSKPTVYTMIASIKFILAYDETITPDLIDSLLIHAFSKVSDDNLEVKQIAIITLMTALNNQFNALTPFLPQILPHVFGELVVRKEYQEIIQIGPFKHKIDKALEVRKNAFEILYKLTLNHAVLKNIDYNEILTQVVKNGVRADIVSISSLIIIKLLEFEDVVLTNEDRDVLKSGIDKLLVHIKTREKDGKDSKEEQETKSTLLILKSAVFPIS